MGIFDNFFGDGNEIPQPVLDKVNPAEIMMPEVRDDMEGFEGQNVIVFGNPIEVGAALDFEQGDNPFGFRGNCGLVSTSNFLNLCGIEADETLITRYAIENGECVYSEFLPPDHNGGTTARNIENILKAFGIESEVFYPDERGGDLESIAEKLEQGYVGMISVNAGYLWDDPVHVGDGSINHRITLTGTVRDGETGELIALTVCDSGSGEPCHVVPIELLQDCYVNAPGADVVFSAEPLRV